jgi:sterol desaturase/sphingolipid hydroxylase (fatty acid hydroxylase superfamily)
MSQRRINQVSGLVGSVLLMAFVIGLAHSISTGFAGFWGGLPFWVIVIFSLLMVGYDYWDSCIRTR